MKTKDTYKDEPTVIVFPDSPRMIATVYHPDITDEERKRRMSVIAKAAENLLKSCEKMKTAKTTPD